MSIVSDASPIISLAWIGQLHLLHRLFGEIVVPQAVWYEIVVKGADKPGMAEVKNAKWITKKTVNTKPLALILQHELDPGESEAIALALEENAKLILMDERLGRKFAQHLGLKFTGVVGILIACKHKKLIGEVKLFLDQLRDVAGFHISDALYSKILREEREI